jgi:hypothetical protein
MRTRFRDCHPRNTHSQHSLTALTHSTHSQHSLTTLTHNTHSQHSLTTLTHSTTAGPRAYAPSHHSQRSLIYILTALAHLHPHSAHSLTTLTHLQHSQRSLTYNTRNAHSLTTLTHLQHSLTYNTHNAHSLTTLATLTDLTTRVSNTDAAMSKISHENASLKAEVASLKAELASLKAQLAVLSTSERINVDTGESEIVHIPFEEAVQELNESRKRAASTAYGEFVSEQKATVVKVRPHDVLVMLPRVLALAISLSLFPFRPPHLLSLSPSRHLYLHLHVPFRTRTYPHLAAEIAAFSRIFERFVAALVPCSRYSEHCTRVTHCARKCGRLVSG